MRIQIVAMICLVLSISVLTTAPANSSDPSATPPSVGPAANATPNPMSREVIFSPSATELINPTSPSGSNPPSQFTIKADAFDAKGNPLAPTKGNPLHLEVYGAPDGVITPIKTKITSGDSATFIYNGEFFPNNIVINGWIADPKGGDAIGVTQVLQANQPPCTSGTRDFSVPLVSTLPDALKIMATVGYTTAASAKGHLKKYTIDTGSLGVIVTTSDLPTNGAAGTMAIGPAGRGVKCYDSSNKAYFGDYYLSPVDIQVTSGSSTTAVKTIPIIVLGANKYCKVSDCKSLTQISCVKNSPIHYMGVGFNRNSTTAGDLFDSPAENAFLHLTDPTNGTDINPGYILSPEDHTTPTGVTLGIDDTSGYNLINLTANTSVPGDWLAQPACYGFPDLPPPNQFCNGTTGPATGLLDVGISEMFLDLPFAQRPDGTYDAANPKDLKVPAGLRVNVLMGSPSNPAMSYTFTTVQEPTSPSGPAPTYSQWFDTTQTGSVFVNTGRDPLNSFDYLYGGQCGFVGFKALWDQF